MLPSCSVVPRQVSLGISAQTWSHPGAREQSAGPLFPFRPPSPGLEVSAGRPEAADVEQLCHLLPSGNQHTPSSPQAWRQNNCKASFPAPKLQFTSDLLEMRGVSFCPTAKCMTAVTTLKHLLKTEENISTSPAMVVDHIFPVYAGMGRDHEYTHASPGSFDFWLFTGCISSFTSRCVFWCVLGFSRERNQ